MNKNLNFLQKRLAVKEISGFLVSAPVNITYLTDFSFLNPSEREVLLLVTERECIAFVSSLIKNGFKQSKQIRLAPLSSRGQFIQEIQAVAKSLDLKVIGYLADDLNVDEFLKIEKGLKQLRVKLTSATGLIEQMRTLKNHEEINQIKKACVVACKVMTHIKRFLQPGKSEKQIAWEAEKYMREQGADELAFKTIVAFGVNSATPHHATSSRKLKKNDIVIVDIGCKVCGYCSDITRTFFVGSPTDKQLNIEQVVKTAHKKALLSISRMPNPTCKLIDSVARLHIAKLGFGEYFMHCLGHGVGLEPHEAPTLAPGSDQILKQNMVFTIEPGVYLPGEFGYRHEDTVLLSESEVEILTK